ncbi:MAG: extracellular solute-binding protein [Lachnospiraceae bacterium]|nr:extracellular solute-binding protein [Lachnospiraceae bacterium]
MNSERNRHDSFGTITKTIRRLFMTAALAASCFMLTACHGSKETVAFEVPENFDESKHYEITFWAKNDTNKTQAAIYQKAISDFEAIYPNIKVNMKLYTDYGKIYNDVITNISTQTTPNVCITYPDHIATYMTGSNVVVPLDDLLTDSSYGLGGSEIKFDAPTKEEIVPEFLSECKIADNYFAVPYMRSTEALYINKTYVEKMGYEIPDVVTWDFVWEVSEAAMEKDGSGNFKVNGQKIMIPFIYKSTDNMMISMLKQLDAGYSDPSGNILLFNDTTQDLLMEISAHGKSGAFSTFKISSYPGNFLNAGQCLFAIDSTAGATWMGSKAPNLDISADKVVNFETIIRPIPQFDVSNPKMISQGPSICIFNKEDSGEVLASWIFTQYMLTNEVQTSYSMTEGYLPVTQKALNSDFYKDYLSKEGQDDDTYYATKIQASKLLMENTENTFVTPVFNGSASLRDASGQLIESVTKSVRRKQTVDDEYIEKLFNDTTSLYHLDQITAGNTGSKDLGPLPSTSVTLLSCLIGAWILIGACYLYGFIKKVRNGK